MSDYKSVIVEYDEMEGLSIMSIVDNCSNVYWGLNFNLTFGYRIMDVH